MTTYRFGFALTSALGNATRSVNLRKYVERDPDVASTFADITHWLADDPYPKRPRTLHNLLVVRHQAKPVTDAWRELDAVVVHGFQLFSWLSLRPRRHGLPLRVLSQDYAPFRTADLLQAYGQPVKDDLWRRQRVRLEGYFTRRADLLAPWSQWAANSLVTDSGVPADRVHVSHPGVDLELWPYVPLPERAPGEPVRILFVGGDFDRKGGDLLVRTWAERFRDVATLDIVTRHEPPGLPAGARAHTGLTANDPTLRRLYAECDLFALPTRADMSSLVSLEAMATGRPVVTTTVGGVGEIVAGADGGGIAVAPDDAAALATALAALIDDPARREAMGRAGRHRVEEHYSTERNTQQLLAVLKQATDASRSMREAR